MSKWKITTHEGTETVTVEGSSFDSGPSVEKGALVIHQYVAGRGNCAIATYNKDFWLKAEIDE